MLDRTGLILDIFAQRARSFEGKLQVELAQLKHIVHAPGARLDAPRTAEGRHRPARPRRDAARDRSPPARPARARAHEAPREGPASSARPARRSARDIPVPVVALVGYTNAGKSTLFNALDRRRRLRRRPAVRDARSDRAPPASAGRHAGGARRHGRLHPRAAARSRRGIPVDAARGARRATCCCTWSMPAIRVATNTSRRSTRCCARSAPAICRSSSSTTRSIGSGSSRTWSAMRMGRPRPCGWRARAGARRWSSAVAERLAPVQRRGAPAARRRRTARAAVCGAAVVRRRRR